MGQAVVSIGGSGGEPEIGSLATASGSGFLVSPDGYIVTNHHVVAHSDSLQVSPLLTRATCLRGIVRV